MLFRNGYKLIFSLKAPGKIVVLFNHFSSTFIPGTESSSKSGPSTEQNMIVAKWGAFADLIWTYQGQEIKKEYLVRYYLSRFIRESAK